MFAVVNVYAFCCQFEIPLLLKDFKMFNGDASEDLFSSIPLSYKFNGFNADFETLFVIFFSSGWIYC